MQDFHGPNAAYILELYERYRDAPDTLDAATRAFFKDWSPPADTSGLTRPSNGQASGGSATSPVAALAAAASHPEFEKIIGLGAYVQAIRQFGHLDAQIDPLGSPRPGDPELSLDYHSLSADDLRRLPASLVDSPVAQGKANAYEATEALRAVYTASVGYDNDHIRLPDERNWLRDAAESGRYRYQGLPEQARALLERLTQVETFETFLQKTFPTKYRFSIEGLDAMVPMLDEVIRLASEGDTATIAIAMAHRGRLNILTHIMEKPYEQILSEFKDTLEAQEMRDAIGWTVGDVKYHKGVSRAIHGSKSRDMVITMPPNPSHLEAVNPVAVGMARAAGTHVNRGGAPVFDPSQTMQILIHGDASFPGQGLVPETFNLSQLPGYRTGGTLHIIANNQVGFTTMPDEGRSTLYASDLAKGFKVPIIHVNADDPAACIEVVRIATAYLEKFEKDFVIDLIGYRRYGHNELDEPGFTQPLMYQKVRNHPTVRQLWANRLAQSGVLSGDDALAIVNRCTDTLQQVYEIVNRGDVIPEPRPTPPPRGAARSVKTAVALERLYALNDALAQFPEDFTLYSARLENTLKARREAAKDPAARLVDWATAEELAFASILEDGTAIRLTGQDSERGTFSHRHAVLHDKNSGRIFVPLQSLPQARAAFEIRNSPLSESAVLGFEYGYSVQAPDRLVLWEAQYGDFNNNAQIIIDEFIVSAREKWGQLSSLVMLLPHAQEGAGPDHSSARLERFLQMTGKFNIRVVYPTTAAQYFHLLRRQAALLITDPLPLIVMSPKSLLRNQMVASSLTDLAEGRWQAVIDDPSADAEQVTRLVLCSGKFYFDLNESETRAQHPEAAVIRVEQLYPLPVDELRAVIERYPNAAQIVWAQEEPKNMGAWEYISWRLSRLVNNRLPVNYVGRRRSSSPAEGSKTAHAANQAKIVAYAFTWSFDTEQGE